MKQTFLIFAIAFIILARAMYLDIHLLDKEKEEKLSKQNNNFMYEEKNKIIIFHDIETGYIY